MIGALYAQTPVSNYTPSKEVADFTAIVKKDYSNGHEILHRSWVELNDMSVIDRMNRDQKTFNAFVDQNVENPAEAWKWRGTRSKARNKAIAMHAQLTAAYIFPSFMAQNEDDEEDRSVSEIMDDCVEWLGHNSNYKSSFLVTTMAMLVNPVTYLGAEWCEVYQKIKERQDDGSVSTREIVDEVLSGFNAPVYSADQILISNAYDQNIQRHRCVLKRRYIEWTEAKAKHGEHENWPYVQPGIKAIYSEDDGLFYEVKDEDHPFLVEEVTYLNRREDTEVCFLNGVYMGEQTVDNNPIKHRDNRGAPKYNVVPFGYQRVNEHFFFYKSLMNSQYWDNQLLDAQYELGMNTAFLYANMPTAFSGTDKIDSEVIFPGATVAFADKDVKATPLLPGLRPDALFGAMRETESSMDESSVSEQTAGQLGPASAKATAVAIAQQNSKTMLMGVGKTLAESIVQFGQLQADIVVNHLSIAEVTELEGDTTKMKYRTLILKGKNVAGKMSDKVIKFDESLLGSSMTEDQKTTANLKMLEETGYPDNKHHLYRVNPEEFARLKFLCRVEPEQMFPKNEEYMQAINSQVYAQFAQNPFVSLEALTRKTLYSYYRGETDELMQEPPQQVGASLLGTPAPQTSFGQQGQNIATGKALKVGATM